MGKRREDREEVGGGEMKREEGEMEDGGRGGDLALYYCLRTPKHQKLSQIAGPGYRSTCRHIELISHSSLKMS